MAAVLSGLAGIPPFDFNTTDISGLANKWKSWKLSFEIYVIASVVSLQAEGCNTPSHGRSPVTEIIPDSAGHWGG